MAKKSSIYTMFFRVDDVGGGKNGRRRRKMEKGVEKSSIYEAK